MIVRQATRVGSRQTRWYVQSETNPNVEYIVHNKRDAVSHRPRWTCNCPDFTERQQFVKDGVCKHIVAAQTFKSSQEAKAAVEAALNAKAVPVTGNVNTAFPIPTVKQVIDAMVRVLNGNRPDAQKLWQVISALRGPDAPRSDTLKMRTTATIRHLLGIEFGGIIRNAEKPLGVEGIDPYYDLDTRIKVSKAVRAVFSDAQDHFVSHYAEALAALKSLGYIK